MSLNILKLSVFSFLLGMTLISNPCLSQALQNNNKKIETIWGSIPFFEGGDIGQYEKTLAQDRDSTRKMLWKELMSEVQKLAQSGAAAEAMLEPMANILLMFDSLHDRHKAIDGVRIDISVENQFKAAFDDLFRQYDIRQSERKIQIGKNISLDQLNVQRALEIYNQTDYITYGTYSNLGSGQFLVTYTMTALANGISNSFSAKGRLLDAINLVALQVFNTFQENKYPSWKNPSPQLTWLKLPVNYERIQSGYTFSEANQYCQARGYRLPFYRELLLAESGTQYKNGGIASLHYGTLVAIADLRETTQNNFVKVGEDSATGGAFVADSDARLSGQFWCVKGLQSDKVQFYNQLMSLFRQYRNNPGASEIFRAIQSVRFYTHDFGINSEYFYNDGKQITLVHVMNSLDEAIAFLKKNNIFISAPN